MSDGASQEDLPAWVAELLACEAARRREWLRAHPERLTRAAVAELKELSDRGLLEDAGRSDRLTQLALAIGELLPDDPLALALARWARGNYEHFQSPDRAVGAYEQALAAYRAAADTLSVARLLGNLIAPLANLGQFAEADRAYHEAADLYAGLGGEAAYYALVLAQNYGWSLHEQGQLDAALALHGQALQLAQTIDGALLERHGVSRDVLVAEIQTNRTLSLGALGRLADAEQQLLRDRAAAEAHRQWTTVARIEANLGELYAALGRPGEALALLDRARTGFAAQRNEMESATVAVIEGALLAQVGEAREARRGFLYAAGQFRARDMAPMLDEALRGAADAARELGWYDEAGRLLDEAEALQPTDPTATLAERIRLAIARGDAEAAATRLAQLHELSPRLDALLAAQVAAAGVPGAPHDPGRLRQAEALYRTALEAARAEGARSHERAALAGLGRLLRDDDPAQAAAHLAAAAAIDDEARLQLSVEELQAGYLRGHSDALQGLALLALRAGRAEEALAAVWRAKGSGLLGLLALRQAGPQESQLDAEIQRARQRLAAERLRVAAESGGSAAAERDDPAIAELERGLFALRRRRNAPIVRAVDGLLADPGALLRQMDADILIEYAVCAGELVAFRTAPDGSVVAAQLGAASALGAAQESLALSLEAAAGARTPAVSEALWCEECLPLLRLLHERLLAPLGPLPADSRLIVAPCEPLALLPFQALWDGERLLLQRCELRLTPTGALLALPPHLAAAGPPYVLGSTGGALTAIADEVRAVQELLAQSRLLLDDPTMLESLDNLEKAPRAIHIAAHSLIRPDVPALTALQTAGGALAVEHCYDLRLSGTDLVTLSSCRSSAGIDSGGSILAFQTAFFGAGARNVIASLWPVADEQAARWMPALYRRYAGGAPAAAALCAAQRDSDLPAAIRAAFACSTRHLSRAAGAPTEGRAPSRYNNDRTI